MGILSSVAIGWLGRRILDWGGWLGTFLLTIIGLYNGLPPAAQQAIQAVVSGHWQDITLGSLIPLAALIWSQIASFRSTVKPQIVTPQGEKVELDAMSPTVQQTMVATAQAAPRKRTLANIIADALAKKRAGH
jgi:hypothetical protein